MTAKSAQQFQRDKALSKNTEITDSVDLSKPLRDSHCLDDFYHYHQSRCVEVPTWGARITNAVCPKLPFLLAPLLNH